MSLEDISVECLVSVDDGGTTTQTKTSAPIHGIVGALRVIVLEDSICRRVSSVRASGVERLDSFAPPTISSRLSRSRWDSIRISSNSSSNLSFKFITTEEHGTVGFHDPTSVPAGGGIIPHDFVRVMHVLPFLVPVSGPSNGVVAFALGFVPFVIEDILVSLLLCEVGVIWC